MAEGKRIDGVRAVYPLPTAEELVLSDAPTPYAEPKEIACFSRSGDRSVKLGDRSALHEFRPPRVGLDLNEGFDRFMDKSGPADLGDVLRAIHHAGAACDRAHFITFRNCLNKLMLTPYATRDGWEIGVVRHSTTTVHLHIIDTETKREQEAERPEHERRMAFWGLAFEAAATATRSEPINANAEFCSVVESKLGGIRIIFGAEVDCEHARDGKGARRYMELKTAKVLSSDKDRHTLERFKMCKWWLQSFLVGIRDICCGFRDDKGTLLKIQHFQTRDLNKFARGKWSGNGMLRFGALSLGWLYEEVIQGPPGAAYILRYEPSRRRLELRTSPSWAPPVVQADGGPSHGDRKRGREEA